MKKEDNVGSFLLTYSKMSSEKKPKNASQWQKTENYTKEEVNLHKFLELCRTGHSWRAGIYRNDSSSFRKDNVLYSRMLSLDLDHCEKSPQELFEYSKKLGIPYNMYYFTYSDTSHLSDEPDEYSYRTVWVLKESIDREEYQSIEKGLIKDLFSSFNPDKACSDISRLWYGGNSTGEVMNCEFSSKETFLRKIGDSMLDRGIKKFKLRDKKTWERFISEHPYNGRIEVPKNWSDILGDRCELWNRFKNGEFIHYGEGRRDLEANFSQLEFKNQRANTHFLNSVFDEVERNSDLSGYIGHSHSYEDIKNEFFTKYRKPEDWDPAPIVKVGNGMVTMCEFFSNEEAYTKGCIELKKTGVHTLDEMEKDFSEKFSHFINSSCPISYLDAQTGSGKTQKVIECIANGTIDCYNQKVVYCVPQYVTQKEFIDRLTSVVGYDFPLYYSEGSNDFDCITKLKLEMGYYDGKVDKDRKDFIYNLKSNDTGLYIITHSLFSSIGDKIGADKVIIDENIEDCLAPMLTIDLTSLYSISNYIPRAESIALRSWMENISDFDRGMKINDKEPLLQAMESLKGNLETYVTENRNIPSGLYGICGNTDIYRTSGMSGYQKDISFIKKSNVIDSSLRGNVNINMMTATPLSTYMSVISGVNPEIFEVKRAGNIGKVTTYSYNSGARGRNDSNVKKLLEYASQKIPRDEIGEYKCITFKGFEDYATMLGFSVGSVDGKKIHAYNNRGLDTYSGQKLAVVGKVDKPYDYYYRLWDVIGDGTPLTSANTMEEINGTKQKIFLFNNEIMKNVQIENLEYFMSQSVGRARAVRTDAEVLVFANYSCRDTDSINYLK